MILAKRRFQHADYGPYMDRIADLQLKYPDKHEQFVMTARRVDAPEPGWRNYYVGVPDETFLQDFDGFQRINEEAVPNDMENILVAGGDWAWQRFKLPDT
jgi:hypothetical protein